LTSQAEVDRFRSTDDILTLTITGESITDLSGLDVQKAKNLVIENTGITNLSIPTLNAITVSMRVVGNPELVAIDGLNNLHFVNGSLTIEDNDVLVDISGLSGLKVFSGNLSIT